MSNTSPDLTHFIPSTPIKKGEGGKAHKKMGVNGGNMEDKRGVSDSGGGGKNSPPPSPRVGAEK